MDTFAGVPDWEDGRRRQTRGEELANSLSHGAGAAAGIAVLPALLAHALKRGWSDRSFVGLGVFGASVVLLYLGSAIYHGLPHGRVKRFFRVAEHMAIYFLIAGTYTPFMLGVLRGTLGTALLWSAWLLTGVGVLFKAFGGTRFPRVSTLLYMGMAWLAIIAVGQLWERMPHAGFWWLIAGSIAYNIGVVFYVSDHRVPYGHFIWHLFVLAGTACHFCAVLWYSGL